MSRLELPGKRGRLLARDDVEAFELFVNTQLRSAVHSSSGRTAPEDELSDFYPVALTREALKPGTIFADPYGHFLVLSDWVPQGPEGYGILVGVDAQPDGTIGQRRFWRGTFLFDSDTTGGGAGFKAFRPRLFKEEPVTVELELDAAARANALARAVASQALMEQALASSAPEDLGSTPSAPAGLSPPVSVPPAAASATIAAPATDGETAETLSITRIGLLEEIENKDLRRSRRYNALSLQQYKGSPDDFYGTVESLINPRPLEPKTMQRALVDAFTEAVNRRVVSVNNGEKWAAEHPGEVVEMPEGDGIFLSTGAWEDFSTPSRDLRLLISIDTVVGFSKVVRLAPERFGLRQADVEARVPELDQALGAELAKRTFSYVRSNGSTQQLTLKDVVDRATSFEMAYNPNDCVELRWAAPPGSPEMSTCVRQAPPEQREKMQSYRAWFSTRKRPPQ